MKKIAFYGNSCTGKTSSLYAIASHLTKIGRTFRIQNMPYDNSGHVKNVKPFGPYFLESTPYARLHFIFNQLAEESRFHTNPDAEFLLCEMTSMDLFHYYHWVCDLSHTKWGPSVRDLCSNWFSSYDTVFCMGKADFYFNDGARFENDDIKRQLDNYYNDFLDKPNTWPVEGRVQDRYEKVLRKFMELYL